MNPGNTNNVVLLHAPDDSRIDEIAQLQLQTFPDGILCALGESFVQDYFRSLLLSPSGGIVCTEMSDTVSGFIAYILDPYDEPFRSQVQKAKRATLQKLLTFHIKPTTLLRGVIKKRKSKPMHGMSELVAFAVDPSLQRQGIGQTLFRAFEAQMVLQNCSRYCVYTDNPEGYQFYRKQNLSLAFEFPWGGRTSAGFIREFASAPVSPDNDHGRS